jgi:hypothetical protein
MLITFALPYYSMDKYIDNNRFVTPIANQNQQLDYRDIRKELLSIYFLLTHMHIQFKIIYMIYLNI